MQSCYDFQDALAAVSVCIGLFLRRATLPLKLPEGASVRVEAFDISGRRVKTIANEQMSAGRHPLSFKTRNLASGLYLVRTVVETASGQRKVFTTKVTAVK